MAIKIPSKKIYNKSIQKVRDNAFDKVTVENTLINPSNEYAVVVSNIYTENLDNFENSQTETKLEQNQRYDAQVGARYYSYSYVSLIGRYGNLGVVKIPRALKNKYVEDLLYGKNDDGQENIKYRVIGNVRKGKCLVTLRAEQYEAQVVNVSETETTFSKEKYSYDYNSMKKRDNDPTPLYAYAYNNHNVSVSSSATLEFENSSTISTAKPKKEIEYFIFDNDHFLYFLCGIYRIEASGGTTTAWGISSFDTTIEGEFEDFTPTRLEVTFSGNTTGIDLTDGSITYGDGKNPFSLRGNELLQDSNTTNGEKTAKVLADNILEQYKNGKETATILCEISNYYDYDTEEKVISIDNSAKMCFDIGDIVIPMTFSYTGKDVPMSVYKDGSAKVFSVVGTKIFYDGAVWQELTLQEVGKE